MKRGLAFLPLAILIAFAALVTWRLLHPADTRIASRMVGQPVPDFALTGVVEGKPGLTASDLRGGAPRLVNVFASWCVPCIGEAPLLGELRKQGVPIDGIAVRDEARAVTQFLGAHGDPFDRIGSDRDSRVQLSLGSSGVPESFIVDGGGVVRYQHMGPIEPQDVPVIVAKWKEAR